MDAEQRIAAVAARQHGLFTWRQALEAGISRAALRRRLANGRWVRVHAHVFRIAGVPPTRGQTLFAAWLAAGPGAVVSHRAAATLWALPGVSPSIEISVPSGRYPSPAGVRIHRTRRLERIDLAARGGMDVTSPTRTVIDLSATLDRDELREILGSCLGRHLTSARFLSAAGEEPAPLCYRHHSTMTDWAADHTRRNALIADGWRILPVTWQDLCAGPGGASISSHGPVPGNRAASLSPRREFASRFR